MFKFKKRISFSNDGRNVIDAEVGDEYEVCDYVAKSFLANGIIEKVTKQSKDSDKKSNKEEKAEVTKEVTADEDAPDLMVIFDEKPELLTVPQLKEICKEKGIKFHHASREAKLISLIKEDKGE